MQRSVFLLEHKTTMSSAVFRIILNDLAMKNGINNFSNGDDDIFTIHLVKRMNRKK